MVFTSFISEELICCAWEPNDRLSISISTPMAARHRHGTMPSYGSYILPNPPTALSQNKSTPCKQQQSSRLSSKPEPDYTSQKCLLQPCIEKHVSMISGRVKRTT